MSFFSTFRPLAEMQRLKSKVLSKTVLKELKSDFGIRCQPHSDIFYCENENDISSLQDI